MRQLVVAAVAVAVIVVVVVGVGVSSATNRCQHPATADIRPNLITLGYRVLFEPKILALYALRYARLC